jgi:hypothetical protein
LSDEFDSLDANEKAVLERALDKCRALADWIESELLKKRPDQFVDKLSLADFYASLERCARILEHENPDRSTPTVTRSQERRGQRQRQLRNLRLGN